jgi:hypothetical protein
MYQGTSISGPVKTEFIQSAQFLLQKSNYQLNHNDTYSVFKYF